MTSQDKWTKAYHKFMTYFPVIVIFSIILLIYMTYVFTYITILLGTSPSYTIAHDNTNNDSTKPSDYKFSNTSSANGAFNKGIILICLESFFLFMLILSILRTIMVNPGFIPSPLDLEYKIITNEHNVSNHLSKSDLNCVDIDADISNRNKNNLLSMEIYNSKQPAYLNLNYNHLPTQLDDEDFIKFKSRSEFDSKAIHDYHHPDNVVVNLISSTADLEEILSESPLTATESITLRSDINQFIEKIHRKHNSHNTNIKNHSKNSSSSSKNHSLDAILENFKSNNIKDLKLCPTCLRLKVERSHHCRMCGKCVLKMDHHCPWLANCIGFRNYKYFLLVHLYGVIATFIVILTYWEVLISAILSYNTTLFSVGFVIFVYVCNMGMFSFLMWLLVTNWRLMFSGQTIIENSDRERFKLTNTVNVYDFGCYKNFVKVFGSNPLVWFMPFFANQEGCGIIYEHNYTNTVSS